MIWLVIAIAVILIFVIAGDFYYEHRKYPMCPVCMDNGHTFRDRILDEFARCAMHGVVMPDVPKRVALPRRKVFIAR